MKNIVSIDANRGNASALKTNDRREPVEAFDPTAIAQLLALHEITVIADDRDQLLMQFFDWAHTLKLADGAQFNLAGDDCSWQAGSKRHHSCNYELDLKGVALGTLTLSRRERYSESELAFLERAILCVCKGLKIYQQLDVMKANSSHDPLTGLLNRQALDQHLDREIARALRHDTRLSLMLLDADQFKAINDQLGHMVGDHVLRTLADLMRDQCREGDSVYRLGGDEFIILLPETGLDQAILAAQRLCNQIALQPASAFFVDDDDKGRIVKQPPRLSIGVAELDREHPCKDALINRADAQMYRAKAKGTGRVN